MAAWLVILTICIPWLGALCVWTAPRVRRWANRPQVVHRLAAAFATLAGLVSLALLPYVSSEVVLALPMGEVFGDFTFVADGLGVFLTCIATVVGSLAVIFSMDYMRGQNQLGRYYSLVLLFIGAMAGLVLSGSILLMFFFWELTAFCSYALISFHNDDPKAVAGGIKALIITTLGGIGLLVGALIAYAYLGSYQISTFLAEADNLPAGVLSLIAFGYLAAAVAKSAQVPLHTWLPDAMEAPTPVTALIHAATMVNAGVYLLARFSPAFAGVPGWTTAVIAVGLTSAVLAAIMALATTDLKRTLAFSTISQLGFMIYSVGVGAVFASQFHLLSHALFKGLLFLGAGAVIHSIGTRDMRLMGGLRKKMPFVCTFFIIGSFALAGLPLTNGFFSKELVLEGGLEGGPAWAFAGMLFGVGLTALYSARMVSMVFFGQRGESQPAHDSGQAMRLSLSVLAIGVLTSWILVGPFSQMLADSLPYHHLPSGETWEVVGEIVIAPTTWFTLGIVGLGILGWMLQQWSILPAPPSKSMVDYTRNGFGFEWFNRQITAAVRGLSGSFSRTQTGQFNWNMVGIVGGLTVLLMVLIWGRQ